MGRSFPVVTFAAVALLPTGAVHAQGAPCRVDMEKFCKDVQPGQGRIRDCLKKHAAELSTGCKAQMEAGRGIFGRERRARGRQPLRRACAKELREYCAGERGRPQRLKCLRAHDSELSDACRDAVGRFPDAAAKPAAMPASEKPESDE